MKSLGSAHRPTPWLRGAAKKVHSVESVELRLPLVWPLDLCFRSNLKANSCKKL
jgi:hypothetical protein